MECVYGSIQIFTFIFRDFPRYLIVTILLVVSSAYEGTVPDSWGISPSCLWTT